MDFRQASKDVGYHAYTTEFDKIVDIADLAVSKHIDANSRLISKYAAGVLTSPAQNDLEDRLLSTINAGGIHGTEHLSEFAKGQEDVEFRLQEHFEAAGINPEETSVTFVIENSGTTRGQTGVHTAMAAVELVEALEGMGVETAVLGYTSRTWLGGSSGEKWHDDGKPEASGRLEDLLHIVFKAPGESYAAKRIHMLADEKLKRENVNGEGLTWGASAAAASRRPNKLLVHVIHKHESHSQYTSKGDKGADAIFHRHFDAVVTEIDRAQVVAMSTVKLGQVGCYPSQPERSDFPGEVPVIHATDMGAGAALEAFVSGTTAAIERASALELQAALVR